MAVSCAACCASWLAFGAAARASSPENARASDDAPRPELALAQEPQAPEAPPPPPARPRMSVAIGMGATYDFSGFGPGVTKAIPLFAAVGDIGDGPTGFALGVYASSASGRYARTDAPVDRLGMDAMLVVRPLAVRLHPDNARYFARLARSFGAELGLGAERDGQSARSGSRFGVHTGLRLELPLTPAGSPTELRVRLSGRRLIGFYEPVVGVTTVHDTTEITGALTFSF